MIDKCKLKKGLCQVNHFFSAKDFSNNQVEGYKINSIIFQTVELRLFYPRFAQSFDWKKIDNSLESLWQNG